MRILKAGVATKQVYIGTCSSCGTEFECDPSEVKSFSDQREGKTWSNILVKLLSES